MIVYKGVVFDSEKSELTNDILVVLEEVFFNCGKLPNDYREFLLTVNGGIPDKKLVTFTMKDGFKNGDIIDGILGIKSKKHLNLLMRNKLYFNRAPSNMICITQNDGANLILLSIKGDDRGKVYFWDHNWEADTGIGEIASYDNLTLLADSFNEFLCMLHEPED
jgi:hypothetical protein